MLDLRNFSKAVAQQVKLFKSEESFRFSVFGFQLSLSLLCAFLLSCEMEVPTEVYDNPLDEEVAAEKGIDTPALVFFPDKFDGVTAGSSVSVQLYALEVPGVTGAYLQVAYDKSKVSISSVNAGDFFSASDDPVFIYEDNSDDGFLNIYSSFLGSDSSATVSGTGNMATLVLSTITAGQSTINYTSESELVDAQDNPVVLNGLGEGVIDVQ